MRSSETILRVDDLIRTFKSLTDPTSLLATIDNKSHEWAGPYSFNPNPTETRTERRYRTNAIRTYTEFRAVVEVLLRRLTEQSEIEKIVTISPSLELILEKLPLVGKEPITITFFPSSYFKLELSKSTKGFHITPIIQDNDFRSLGKHQQETFQKKQNETHTRSIERAVVAYAPESLLPIIQKYMEEEKLGIHKRGSLYRPFADLVYGGYTHPHFNGDSYSKVLMGLMQKGLEPVRGNVVAEFNDQLKCSHRVSEDESFQAELYHFPAQPHYYLAFHESKQGGYISVWFSPEQIKFLETDLWPAGTPSSSQ